MSSNNFNFNFRADSWFETDNPQDTKEARIKALMEEFKRRFPTRADCVRELCKHKFEYNDAGELLCPYCRFPQAKIDYTKRATKCKKCKKKIWLTAGTFFHKSKKPEAWLAIIWFIEAGLILSSLHFHDLLGIAQSTAWTMLQTILQAVRLQLEESEEWSELKDNETVDTATLISSAAFIELFIKRSLETPKREHPSQEEEEQVKESREAHNKEPENEGSADAQTTTTTESKTNNFQQEQKTSPQNTKETNFQNHNLKLKIEEQQVLDLIDMKTPRYINDIQLASGLPMNKLSSILTMLELQQLIERLPGDRYVRSTPDFSTTNQADFSAPEKSSPERLKQLHASLKKFQRFIKASFHGISRKYLQSYIAAFWTQIDPLWQNSYLLKACQQLEPISYRQIQEQVSPLRVHFPC